MCLSTDRKVYDNMGEFYDWDEILNVIAEFGKRNDGRHRDMVEPLQSVIRKLSKSDEFKDAQLFTTGHYDIGIKRQFGETTYHIMIYYDKSKFGLYHYSFVQAEFPARRSEVHRYYSENIDVFVDKLIQIWDDFRQVD